MAEMAYHVCEGRRVERGHETKKTTSKEVVSEPSPLFTGRNFDFFFQSCKCYSVYDDDGKYQRMCP